MLHKGEEPGLVNDLTGSLLVSSCFCFGYVCNPSKNNPRWLNPSVKVTKKNRILFIAQERKDFEDNAGIVAMLEVSDTQYSVSAELWARRLVLQPVCI